MRKEVDGSRDILNKDCTDADSLISQLPPHAQKGSLSTLSSAFATKQ